jgi:hypothetical protein
LIESAAFTDVLMLALSVTVTVKFCIPAVVGVPLITPVPVFKLSPVGSVPAVTAQV